MRQTSASTDDTAPDDLYMSQEPALRRYWYAVGFADAVTAEATAIQLLGHDLVVQRDADGAVSARRTGGAVRTTESLGLVWASLVAEPGGGIPDLPEFTDPAYRCIPIGPIEVPASAAAIIDNNTDGTHVAYVHRGTFGAGQDPRFAVPHVERTSFGIRIVGEQPVANRPGEPAPTVRASTTEMWMPFVQLARMHFPDGLVHILFKACCPHDDRSTTVFFSVLRTDTEADASAADIIAFERAVELEDAGVLSTLPAGFPLDVTRQVHTRYDRPGIELRRAYTDLCRPIAPA